MKSRMVLQIILFMSITFFITNIFAQPEIDSIKRKIKQNAEIMNAALLDGDYKTLLDFYADDVVIMPDFAPVLRGKKSLQKQYRKDKADGLKYHSMTGTPEKIWMTGDQIYEQGTWGMAVSSDRREKPSAYYGSYFQIWRIDSDDEIKIIYTIWNLDFNPFH